MFFPFFSRCDSHRFCDYQGQFSTFNYVSRSCGFQIWRRFLQVCRVLDSYCRYLIVLSTNNLLVTYFHEFWIYESTNYLYEKCLFLLKELQSVFFVRINSFSYIFFYLPILSWIVTIINLNKCYALYANYKLGLTSAVLTIYQRARMAVPC